MCGKSWDHGHYRLNTRSWLLKFLKCTARELRLRMTKKDIKRHSIRWLNISLQKGWVKTEKCVWPSKKHKLSENTHKISVTRQTKKCTPRQTQTAWDKLIRSTRRSFHPFLLLSLPPPSMYLCSCKRDSYHSTHFTMYLG